jgi:hypothetical protein
VNCWGAIEAERARRVPTDPALQPQYASLQPLRPGWGRGDAGSNPVSPTSSESVPRATVRMSLRIHGMVAATVGSAGHREGVLPAGLVGRSAPPSRPRAPPSGARASACLKQQRRRVLGDPAARVRQALAHRAVAGTGPELQPWPIASAYSHTAGLSSGCRGFSSRTRASASGCAPIEPTARRGQMA